jgi:hypothetical protein
MWSSWWNENSQGNPKYSEITRPSVILSTANSTGSDLGLKLGRRGGNSATNCLSSGTASERGKTRGKQRRNKVVAREKSGETTRDHILSCAVAPTRHVLHSQHVQISFFQK